MSNFLLLLKVRLDQMFEISATFRQSKLNKKVGMISHHIIMILLYGIIFGVIYRLADYLKDLGFAGALPVIGYFGAVALTFIFTIIKINETFTGNEDSEFLLSMPFSSATQVFVMFVMMYIRNLLCCVLIELPIYLVFKPAASGTLAFGTWLWGLLLTSLPMCGIAVLVGMFIILSIVHMPQKNQIISGIALFFTAIAIVLGIVMADRIYLVATGRVTFEGEVLADGLVKEICRNFKFGRFYQKGIVEGDTAYIFLFSFLSLIWYVILLFMHTMAYQSVITQLRCPIAYGELERKEVVKRLKEHNLFMVLLKKEFNQFTRSENYLLQCSIGVLLGIAVPVNFLIIGTSGLEEMQIMIPLLLCLFVGISNITYCSMSMEGKRHWIIEAAPLEISLLRNAKLSLSLFIMAPMVVFGGIIMGIAFNLNMAKTLLYIVIALIYAVIISLCGNIIGERFADYGSESESVVLHRGMPFLIGYLPGIYCSNCYDVVFV